MRKSNGWRAGRLLGLVALTLWGAQAAYAVPIVSVQPSGSAQVKGSTFALSVDITSVTDLYGYQFDVGFDPSILAASSVTEGAFLSGAGSTFFIPGTIDNTLGVISFTANTLLGPGPGASGDGVLADVLFQALATGSSSVQVTNVLLLDSTLTDMPFEVANGTVRVEAGAPAPVPEPGTFGMLGTGFAALAWGARRRSRT